MGRHRGAVRARGDRRRDQAATLSPAARRGYALFTGRARCSRCHAGPLFTDEDLHSTAVAFLDGDPTDLGGGSANFKTPTLREVARTAPYMHDGSLATLDDVIEFYSEGGRPNPGLDREIAPRSFTVSEKQALVAFLRSLSGTVLGGSQ